MYFAIGDYEKASEYNHKYKKTAEQRAFSSSAPNYFWLRELFVQYEKEDYRGLQYTINLAKEYLGKQEKVSRFEEWGLRFFEELLLIKDIDKSNFSREEGPKLLAILKTRGNNYIDDLNVFAWFRMRIDGSTYEKAIQQLSLCRGDYEKYRQVVI